VAKGRSAAEAEAEAKSEECTLTTPIKDIAGRSMVDAKR